MKEKFILCFSILIMFSLFFVACEKKEVNDNRVSEINADNTYIFKTNNGMNLALKEGDWWPILTKDMEPKAFKIMGTDKDNYYYIYDTNTKRVLEVNDGKKENGVKLNMWEITGEDNQFFIIMTTKEAYTKYLNENDEYYDKGKENEFLFVTSNDKFFTDSENGVVTGDNPVNACHFIAYISNEK